MKGTFSVHLCPPVTLTVMDCSDSSLPDHKRTIWLGFFRAVVCVLCHVLLFTCVSIPVLASLDLLFRFLPFAHLISMFPRLPPYIYLFCCSDLCQCSSQCCLCFVRLFLSSFNPVFWPGFCTVDELRVFPTRDWGSIPTFSSIIVTFYLSTCFSLSFFQSDFHLHCSSVTISVFIWHFSFFLFYFFIFVTFYPSPPLSVTLHHLHVLFLLFNNCKFSNYIYLPVSHFLPVMVSHAVYLPVYLTLPYVCGK